MKPSLLIVIAFLLSGSLSPAQRFSVEGLISTAGGGTSAGDQFTVAGSVATADPGKTTGNSRFQISEGTWSAAIPIQSPEAPTLQISTPANDGTLALSWTEAGAAAVLETSASLGSDAVWTSVQTPVQAQGSAKKVIMTLQPGLRFFRLRLPSPAP